MGSGHGIADGLSGFERWRTGVKAISDAGTATAMSAKLTIQPGGTASPTTSDANPAAVMVPQAMATMKGDLDMGADDTCDLAQASIHTAHGASITVSCNKACGAASRDSSAAAASAGSSLEPRRRTMLPSSHPTAHAASANTAAATRVVEELPNSRAGMLMKLEYVDNAH